MEGNPLPKHPSQRLSPNAGVSKKKVKGNLQVCARLTNKMKLTDDRTVKEGSKRRTSGQGLLAYRKRHGKKVGNKNREFRPRKKRFTKGAAGGNFKKEIGPVRNKTTARIFSF